MINFEKWSSQYFSETTDIYVKRMNQFMFCLSEQRLKSPQNWNHGHALPLQMFIGPILVKCFFRRNSVVLVRCWKSIVYAILSGLNMLALQWPLCLHAFLKKCFCMQFLKAFYVWSLLHQNQLVCIDQSKPCLGYLKRTRNSNFARWLGRSLY